MRDKKLQSAQGRTDPGLLIGNTMCLVCSAIVEALWKKDEHAACIPSVTIFVMATKCRVVASPLNGTHQAAYALKQICRAMHMQSHALMIRTSIHAHLEFLLRV